MGDSDDDRSPRSGPTRLLLGSGAAGLAPTHVVAMHHDQVLEARQVGARVATFRQAMAAHAAPSGVEGLDLDGPADDVVVTLPTRRGLSFVAVLSWLLTGPLAGMVPPTVRWLGPTSERGATRRSFGVLASLGWTLTDEPRTPDWLGVTATRPEPGPPLPPPVPAAFEARVGSTTVSWSADWGVFSATQIDPGTRLLLETVGPMPLDSVVTDIGCGYGPLALGLLAAGRGGRAVGSEVDDVALYLFERNAEALGLEARACLEADPGALDPAGLTVCNFPTHAARANHDLLLGGLVERARAGRVVLVVHRSLADRFRGRVADRGATATVLAADRHSVLEIHPGG
jgi:predicted RNA methylase